jgi:hypothetical protein
LQFEKKYCANDRSFSAALSAWHQDFRQIDANAQMA